MIVGFGFEELVLKGAFLLDYFFVGDNIGTLQNYL